MSAVRDEPRLRALLGGPEWRWWRSRARTELEAGRELPAVISLASPSADERDAANRLFATPGVSGAVRVRHGDLVRLRAADIPPASVAAVRSRHGRCVRSPHAICSTLTRLRAVRASTSAVGSISLV